MKIPRHFVTVRDRAVIQQSLSLELAAETVCDVKIHKIPLLQLGNFFAQQIQSVKGTKLLRFTTDIQKWKTFPVRNESWPIFHILVNALYPDFQSINQLSFSCSFQPCIRNVSETKNKMGTVIHFALWEIHDPTPKILCSFMLFHDPNHNLRQERFFLKQYISTPIGPKYNFDICTRVVFRVEFKNEIRFHVNPKLWKQIFNSS